MTRRNCSSAGLKKGERRERFFADDDVSLDELVARERKEGRQAKYDAHYADNIARDRRLKENAEYDSDDEYGDGGSAHTKYEERWVIPTAIHRTLLRTRRRFCGPGSDARPVHLRRGSVAYPTAVLWV